MYKNLFFLLLAVLLVTSACKRDEIDDDDDPITCDTENVSYSADIVPILSAFCYGCHGPTVQEAGFSLETYASVKFLADNGSLVGAVTHSPGFTPMPFEMNKLEDCDVAMIVAWVEDGAPEN